MKQVICKLMLSILLFATHSAIIGAINGTVADELVSHDLSFTGSQSKTLSVTVVMPKMSEIAQQSLLQKTRKAVELSQSRMGLGFRDDFSIFFDSRPPLHNGLTTVIPTNRISVHLEAPVFESTIGLNRDYLTETLVHELSHMLVTQTRSGIFNFFDHVVGNTSRPMGAWPRWLHEGMAVWTEEVVGGRPTSGMIQFDLRRYAEYFARLKKHPLDSSDMDGNATFSLVDEGAFPYHFGYLLVQAWYELREKKEWGEVIERWANTPGIGFRVMFRNDHQKSLSDFFEAERKKWSEHSLPSVRDLKGEEVARASYISGPFSYRLKSENGSYFRAQSWIESASGRRGGSILKGKLDRSAPLSLKWRLGYSYPIQAYLAERGWWVLYAQIPEVAEEKLYAGKSHARHYLGFFDSEGREMCRLPTHANLLREFALFEDQIAWIESQNQGSDFVIQRGFLSHDCQVQNVVEVTRNSKPFERLTSLNFEESQVIYSRQIGIAPFEIVEVDGQRQIHSDAMLSLAYPFGKNWIAHRFSEKSFEPFLFEWDGQSLKKSEVVARGLSLKTGSFRSVPGSLEPLDQGGVLLLKESFWENDRLVLLKKEDFIGVENKLTILGTERASASETADAVVLTPKDYSIWPSIVPEFWLPTLQAYSGGYAFFGQTYFSDLRERWSGTFVAGYDSYPARPFSNFSVTRVGRIFLPFHSHTLTMYYSPTAIQSGNTKIIFSKTGTELGSQTLYLLRKSSLRLSGTLGLRYEMSRSSAVFADQNYFSPSLGFSLSSPSVLNSSSSRFRLADIGSGWGWTGRVRKIFANETLSSLHANARLGRTGLYSRIDWAITDPKNYPLSYFEFGGNFSFSTLQLGYLTRGFAPRLGTGKELLRGELQWGFPVMNLRRGLSWNRLRLKQWDMRVLAETVTFQPFAQSSRFSLGKGYFHSFGTEWDFFGTFSQYVNFTATLGAYRGLGEFGENRMALRISSYLDL